ncbi:epoxide hydrolase [Hyaloraphidium curvatum]|nr:epoxide hydrolase [Hyaloraphidium curvatum]
MSKKELAITEHTFTGPPRDGHNGHTTYYLAAGPESGTPCIMVHGWPERAISWRHVIPVLAGLGFRCYAPDMRGYGNSSVYKGKHDDYRLELIVKDLLELADHVGARKAVWIGHDWGSPAVGFTPENFLPLVDRDIYPEDKYPWGQWDYQREFSKRFYQVDFGSSQRLFEKDVDRTFKLFFRAGDPSFKGQPVYTATICEQGGWFGNISELPDLPIDESIITEDDLKVFADGLRQNGFFGADSWYMNHDLNGEYAKKAPNGGILDFPVLMIHARYDWVCESAGTRLADPMRESCKDLTEFVVDAGHWIAQEKPAQVSSAIAQWLARRLPGVWTKDGSEEITRK